MSDIDLIPLKEVQRLLHVSGVTLWKWEKQGKIKVVRLSSRKVYVERKEIDRLIAQGKK
jgi:predicted site-specific integrase-resolvase